MPELLLVCEGTPTSLDVRVLEIALKPLTGRVSVRVYPAGDAKGRGMLCDALGIPSNQSLEIKDRDFLPRATTLVLQPRVLRWRRHEVENFLVDPDVVLVALTLLRRDADAPAWLATLPVDRVGVVDLLANIARPLLPRYVGGLITSELARRCTLDNPTTFRRPRPPTDTADAWAAALTTEATRVRQGCGALATDSDLDPATLDARYRARLRSLEGSAFLTSEDFVLDMEGKCLRDGLLQVLRQAGARRLSANDLDTLLLQGLEELIGRGHCFAPDDFGELCAEVLRTHDALLPPTA